MFRTAPYMPPIDPSSASDTQNFDDIFLDMDTDQEREQTDQEPTDGEDSVATPSQSRSSSAHPPNDLVDVFDGYSFGSQLAHIIEDDEDVSEEDDQEEEEDQDITKRSILAKFYGTVATGIASAVHEKPWPEPKAPELWPVPLPPWTPPAKWSPLDIHHKEHKKASVLKPHGQRSNRQRNRHEKSGVPALDRDLSDANDEDKVRTERDEEVEDWDFIEDDGEERSGVRGNGLYARGVIDQFTVSRLAALSRSSTPNRVGPGATGDSEGLPAAIDGPNSPSPIAKERRRFIGALPFRRAPKTFLRHQSPPSMPTRSGLSPGPLSRPTSNATTSTMQTLYTARTSLGRFSLRSEKSTFSVDSHGSSSHASTSGNARAA
jgi:serum/glucocorticoid-regulated kinase 2